jgi:oligosaccharyltransferase complex subunit epsilon
MTASLTTVVTKFYEEYAKTTPSKLKLIDAYLFYILLTGVVQFLYCCLVGTFPFNSFLSGFISCVGSFVLAGKLSFILSPVIFLVLHIQHSNILIVFSYTLACLRLQVNPENKGQFEKISPERAFADFIFAHVVLHLTVMNFIG